MGELRRLAALGETEAGMPLRLANSRTRATRRGSSTPAESADLQALIDNMYGQFVQAVADGRHAKTEDIKAIANGKVWTGQQALSMKMIDQLGDFQDAVKDTAKAVGISVSRCWCIPLKTARRY